MAQYIPKSALVAEIEKLYNGEIDTYTRNILDRLKSNIDTLETKEVDLEKEIKKVQRKYKTIEEYKGYPCTMYADNIEWIANHFFELGMAVSNKAQKGEEI